MKLRFYACFHSFFTPAVISASNQGTLSRPMFWVTIRMCSHNVPRPPDAFKYSTLGLLNITVILAVTVSDKRSPSRFMRVLVRHHRASRIPSLLTLSVPFTLTMSPCSLEGPTGLDRQHHSQGEPTNIRPLLQTKHEEFRSSLATFFKILFVDQRLCSVLFSWGGWVGGGFRGKVKYCVTNQQGCKHVERVTSYIVEECASEGGEGGHRWGSGWRWGVRSSHLEPVWQQWVTKRNQQLKLPPLTPRLFFFFF